jgi:DNA-binding response OmpR family regulator
LPAAVELSVKWPDPAVKMCVRRESFRRTTQARETDRGYYPQTGMRVLVIEDEVQLAGHISRALARHGHAARAEYDGPRGLQAALDDPPDLIVLDLNLPGLDGMSVLARLRQAHCVARVLVLTARGEVEHRVKGLQAGADDYLAKPFSMDELVARIDALGRRGGTPTAADLLKVADLQLDVRHRRVTRAGKPIALSPREFDVLHVLMQEPGRPFSRTELCERVWQRDHEYDTRTVEIFIARLRKKIDSAFAAPLIHTLRAVGYTIRPPD